MRIAERPPSVQASALPWFPEQVRLEGTRNYQQAGAAEGTLCLAEVPVALLGGPSSFCTVFLMEL